MRTQFYSAAHAAALERKNKRGNAVFALVCALTLFSVAFFALRRGTLNAKRMEFCATAAMTLGGWVAIAIADCALRCRRALCGHERRILASAEPARELRGLVTLDRKNVSIARSIDVRGVRVQTADGPVRLLVAAAFAKALEREAAHGELTVRAVEGYVTEVER